MSSRHASTDHTPTDRPLTDRQAAALAIIAAGGCTAVEQVYGTISESARTEYRASDGTCLDGRTVRSLITRGLIELVEPRDVGAWRTSRIALVADDPAAAEPTADETSTDGLTLAQADGLACVVCSVDYLTGGGPSVPVGNSHTGSQIFACVGACAESLDKPDAAPQQREASDATEQTSLRPMALIFWAFDLPADTAAPWVCRATRQLMIPVGSKVAPLVDISGDVQGDEPTRRRCKVTNLPEILHPLAVLAVIDKVTRPEDHPLYGSVIA